MRRKVEEKVYRKMDNKDISADDFSSVEWSQLKKDYSVGDFLMFCCQQPAIPKTSENGVQFFSHLSDECGNAPETLWHKEVKSMIQNFCTERSILCRVEEPGAKRKWQADIYIEYNERKIVIEIQRSYQHRDKFYERQKRYKESGIECFWLARQDVYRTFVSTDANYRLRTEYGGKFPAKLPIGTADLPIIFLELDPEIKIRGGGLFASSFDNWMESIFRNTFAFDGYIWRISDLPLN